MSPESRWPDELPAVGLIGAGVVGEAIAETHRLRRVAFCIADQDRDRLRTLGDRYRADGTRVEAIDGALAGLPGLRVGELDVEDAGRTPVVIESIVEQVAAKQQLFNRLQQDFGTQPVLCTNTSTLQLSAIATDQLAEPGRVCGMHFFMPVHLRPAVEIVSGPGSDEDAVAAASEHAARIGKQTIPCRDGPGFIVNRMLSPYLNQALWLLCRGASEGQIERAARAYGMPLSPLELIDWIGTATMYHAGKAFWSAFPKRLEPSPVIPALLKGRRFGRASGAGLYDYHRGVRSPELAVETCEIVHRYRRDPRKFSDGEVLELLTIPMWIEATKLLDAGIADSMATVDLAMAGGLGYNSDVTWSGFFAELGQQRIADSIERHRHQWNSMRI